MTMVCVSCSKTVPARIRHKSLRGQFEKLCRACHFTADEATGQHDPASNNFIESFVSFTCNYGYIIGIIFCIWIVQASLHRRDVPQPQVEISQKSILVKTSQLIPLIGP